MTDRLDWPDIEAYNPIFAAFFGQQIDRLALKGLDFCGPNVDMRGISPGQISNGDP
jgi:hypothetical protein